MTYDKASVGLLHPYDVEAEGWSRRDATHLLWRTQFGASSGEIDSVLAVGLAGTVERLVTPQAESPAFQASQRLLRRVAEDTGNIQDLKAWWLYRMVHSANPLVEKMTLFWHSHFATSQAKVGSVRHMADQNDLMRRETLGSFSTLLSGMARDVAMLLWLDGNANRKRHPNENFARELMELFSLGEGNYSERDVTEAARAFTGWHVRKDQFWFDRRQHDGGVKTVLGHSGTLDGDDVITLCLAEPACARFLARKLLVSFVKAEPGEASVAALADSIQRHDYRMAPVLRELLLSRLFFAPDARRSLIKGPADFVLGAYRAMEREPNLQENAALMADLGQDLFAPPTVKGWEGGRLWINASSVLQRANLAANLSTDPMQATRIRLLAEQPGELVQYCGDLLIGEDLDERTLEKLTEYVRAAEGNLEAKARGLIHLMMTLPEYQLM